MFCPSCGAENTTGLNYCNRCGANLAALMSQPEVVQVSLTRPATLIGIIMMLLTLGGFVVLIAGARALAPIIVGNDPLIAVIFMGMLTILIVDIFLARQLNKLINAALGGATKGKQGRIAPPVTAHQLPRPNTAPIFQPTTVTENTTRFLEGDYRAPEPQPAEKPNS